MLPIRIYTIEDFYKFYEVITPFLDKYVTYHGGFIVFDYIRVEFEELRNVLKDAFPQEANSLPSVFLNFVNLMMNEMNCMEHDRGAWNETGIIWYDVSAYFRKKEREMNRNK